MRHLFIFIRRPLDVTHGSLKKPTSRSQKVRVPRGTLTWKVKVEPDLENRKFLVFLGKTRPPAPSLCELSSESQNPGVLQKQEFEGQRVATLATPHNSLRENQGLTLSLHVLRETANSNLPIPTQGKASPRQLGGDLFSDDKEGGRE